MDNIRIIDTDADGNRIEQADGSAWVAMFCLIMLRIAVELAALRGTGRRPVFGGVDLYDHDALWKDYLHFSENFHGATGTTDTPGRDWGLAIRPGGPDWSATSSKTAVARLRAAALGIAED